MKGGSAFLVPLVLLVSPLAGYSYEAVVPAGTLVQCTVSEPNFSSKTAAVGDPVLCQASPIGSFGRSVLPYGTYMVGLFTEYKDPGHLVGKGWMELKFDRMVVPPGQIIPFPAKVVYVQGMPVDRLGRIHGKGHPVRDAIAWSIPILWPIDLLNLPRRGPRPRLKGETRLMLKVMDDVAVSIDQPAPRTLMPRSSLEPSQSSQFGFATRPPVEAVPGIGFTGHPALTVAPAYRPPVVAVSQSSRMQSLTVLMLKDGNGRLATDYWFEGNRQLRFISTDGKSIVIPVESLDLPATVDINRRRGVGFIVRSEEPGSGS